MAHHCPTVDDATWSTGINRTRGVALSPSNSHSGLLSEMPFSRNTEFPFSRLNPAGAVGAGIGADL